MDLFENPIALAQKVQQLHRAVVRWQQAMRRGHIDESGPFIGKPELTTREAFRQIRETNQAEPLRSAWLRWAYYLSDARVNAASYAALASAYASEQHWIERPEPARLTLRDLAARLLERGGERGLWADQFAANASRARSLALEQVTRREEMANRAGLQGALGVTLPDVDLLAWVERTLVSTESVYRELAPTQLERWLDAALALSAQRGWPAQITPATLQSLLGSREWIDGLDLEARSLPKPLAASSFARGLGHLGSAMLSAAAPSREPYVIAHDPYGLWRHNTGALLARLTTSEIWQARQLGLSKPVAREQARALLLSELISLRVKALAVLVAERALHSAASFERSFAELSERCLGFCLPLGFAGVMPKIRVNAGQRLIGHCLSVEWTSKLVAEFDSDWFRNPRAILATRDTIQRVLPITPTPEQEASLPGVLRAEYESKL